MPPAQPLRRATRRGVLLVLTGVAALAGCFTDYAPSTSNALGGSTGAATGASEPLLASTGGDTDDTGSTGAAASTGVVVMDSDAGESTSGADGSSTGAGALAIPSDPYARCLAQTAMTACGACLCDECLEQFAACDADPGCRAIEACAAAHGCDDLGCLDPCQDVIDMHGGLGGESSLLALGLSTCFNNKCDC